MPTIPLSLHYHPASTATPSAWFLPGENISLGLNELCQTGIPLKGLKLYFVPCSAGSPRIQGALISGNELANSKLDRAQPYQCVAGRIYIPVAARIDPPMSESEWRDVLPDEGLFVWHPSAGLTRFEPGDAIRVADLLQSPPRQSRDWSKADPGISLNVRLHQIDPDDPPTLQQILESGRDDIATETPTLNRLPPSPNESDGPEKPGFGARIKSAIARAALKFTGNAPTTASQPTWINGLENWANRMLKSIAEANPLARKREVDRLLHLLETNPQEGLKFAIPFSPGDQHRGVAPPSNRLGERNIDFDLGRMGGGSGPADFWELSDEQRQKLMQRYRELATREISLGRFRRAAYIFAELIGDIPAAAGTLMAGKHFREAAVLYRDRLQQPLQAAKCLEQGGLLAEAATLYQANHEFEKAGDLRLRLEEPEEAQRLFGLAVDKQLAARDYLAAAALCEKRLSDELRALEILERDWSHGGPQWQGRLTAWYELCGRTGRHALAGDRSRRFLADSSALKPDLLDRMAGLATEYVDPGVRAILAEATRTGVSKALRSTSPPVETATARQLTTTLSRLHAEDRLLVRDGERFTREIERREKERKAAEERAKRQRSRLPSRPPSRSGQRAQLQLVRQFALPKNVDWNQAVSAGETYYVSGHAMNTLVVGRGFWDERPGDNGIQTVNWRPQLMPHSGKIIVAPDAQDQRPLFVHFYGRPPLIDRSFPPVNRAPYPLPAGSPSWIQPETAGIVRGGKGLDWGLDLEGSGNSPELRVVIRSFSPEGHPNVSFTVAMDMSNSLDGEPPEVPIPAAFGDEALHFAVGRQFVSYRPPNRVVLRDLPQRCHSLCRTPPHTVLRVALFHERGGTLCWPEGDGELVPFGQDLEWPKGCFTLGGWLAVNSEGRISIFRIDGQKVTEVVSQDTPDLHRPFAVLPTSRFGQFAVFDDNQVMYTVRIYQVSLF